MSEPTPKRRLQMGNDTGREQGETGSADSEDSPVGMAYTSKGGVGLADIGTLSKAGGNQSMVQLGYGPGFDDRHMERLDGASLGPANAGHTARRRTTYERCVEPDKACFGPEDSRYDAAEKAYSEKLRSNVNEAGGGLAMERVVDGRREYSLDGGESFLSEDDFQAEAVRRLESEPNAWSGERIAELVEEYWRWVVDNYRFYGSFTSGFHKDDPQPEKPMDATIMDGMSDGAKRASENYKALNVMVTIIFGAPNLMVLPVIVAGGGSTLFAFLTGPFQGTTRSVAGLSYSHWKSQVDWGTTNDHERKAVCNTLRADKVVARFFSQSGTNAPLQVRAKMKEIVEGQCAR